MSSDDFDSIVHKFALRRERADILKAFPGPRLLRAKLLVRFRLLKNLLERPLYTR